MDDHKYPEFRQGWPTAKVFGTVSGAVALGSGMSPLLFGPLIDASGNYDSLLLICIGLATLGASLFLTLGPYPDFEEVEDQELDTRRAQY